MKILNKKTLSGALILSVLAVSVGYAEEKDDNSRSPIGCRDVGYKFDLTTLQLLPGEKGETQSMYFIFNLSNQPVNLYQMLGEESSHSTYLNHAIGAQEWAVLSTNEKQIKFVCATPQAKSEYGKMVNCAETLRICEYTNVRYGLNNRGNYWLVNSSTRNGAVREVVNYGIIPGN